MAGPLRPAAVVFPHLSSSVGFQPRASTSIALQSTASRGSTTLDEVTASYNKVIYSRRPGTPRLNSPAVEAISPIEPSRDREGREAAFACCLRARVPHARPSSCAVLTPLSCHAEAVARPSLRPVFEKPSLGLLRKNPKASQQGIRAQRHRTFPSGAANLVARGGHGGRGVGGSERGLVPHRHSAPPWTCSMRCGSSPADAVTAVSALSVRKRCLNMAGACQRF
ncbi:uncharacterized protein B0H64DRAFT_242829 [Chaetomium fimeti]|uniref:Uncharacterized protein n=1 Tax=Chaetomium fimeti TaxID=1854472 RepID=A0AAE0H8H2_9PEZI|nr:hypothetical protein B0H64DRAFT_242829 [Chaetomium fimeti]